MSIIHTENGLYQLAPYSNEAELEDAIQKVKSDLFGKKRIYLDIKRKIGKRGIQENIPDGYLIDLNRNNPKLFFVENELVSHDAIGHIGKQILEFSIAFEVFPKKVRNILFEEITSNSEIKNLVDDYILKNNYRNFDHFLDFLIENPFSALIVIDEEHSKLENLVIPKLNFNVDVIHLARYQNEKNNYFYRFEPFLQDIAINVKGQSIVTNINPDEFDTIIVPARKNGFEQVFLGENRWYEVRMESSMREKIKYIAAYQVSPISAITHLATVKSIKPWGDSGKWVVNFEEKAQEIASVVLKKDGEVKALQSHRYALKEKLLNATILDEIW